MPNLAVQVSTVVPFNNGLHINFLCWTEATPVQQAEGDIALDFGGTKAAEDATLTDAAKVAHTATYGTAFFPSDKTMIYGGRT